MENRDHETLPSEWTSTLFFEKYKSLMLESYDDMGSPNRHMYAFLSQTGHLIGNDPIMTKIFVSIV